MSSSESEIRIQKIQEIREMGKDPYPPRYYPSDYSADVLKKFQENETPFQVNLAGRVILKRVFGKSLFMTLRDSKGDIQVFGHIEQMKDEYEFLKKKIDIGDMIGVKGEVFKTHKGETTVNAFEVTLLSKAINPLPEKFHGLTDVETRYRQRYVDMIVNPEVKDNFVIRAKVIQAIRQYLYQRDFIEVETPILQQIPGGANAKPFITHHNALSMDLYLRIAPELYLKRIITGGIEKIFEMGRVFRNEGISTRHNPEFTMIELYQAYADFNDMMKLTEEMIASVIKDIKGSTVIEYQGKTLDFTVPWKRLRMDEAVKQFSGIDINQVKDRDELEKKAVEAGLPADKIKGMEYWKLFNTLFEEKVETMLEGPVFITHYPSKTTPLAKNDPSNPLFVERFELFIAGREHANAYSELNDPILQKEKLMEQVSEKKSGDDEAMYFDSDFVNCLEYGMPPTGGLGIGIDRLMMIILNAPSIRDTLIFPHMKPVEE
ncbi:MAG TPA: lysine--tRNA ligase [Spirochaetia bacterium]|nr:MAG: lysine--tRNA ligase [Spirochaetes bacterium GWB1_36_13]HCL58059.1 lysine--tRNA ligase [Spirochaetia bacterium]